jgi:hypothetical protein
MTSTRFKLCGVSMMLLFAALVCSAGDQAATQTNRFHKAIDKVFTTSPEAPESVPIQPALPANVSFTNLDRDTQEKYLEVYRGYLEYRLSGYQHRKAIFTWQLFSSKCIFVVVVLLVLTGIYFSWLQFRLALKKAGDQHGRQQPTAGTEPVVVTEIEASAKGLKVSSPVLGVIILTLSLLFFYLYLVHVYPISDIL